MTDDGKLRKSLNEARKGAMQSRANLDHFLELWGDNVAKKEGYSVDGMEAVWLYLIRTYKWTPAYVKSMNGDDMRLVLDVEMQKMKANE